jgi:hypothetical protein
MNCIRGQFSPLTTRFRISPAVLPVHAAAVPRLRRCPIVPPVPQTARCPRLRGAPCTAVPSTKHQCPKLPRAPRAVPQTAAVPHAAPFG